MPFQKMCFFCVEVVEPEYQDHQQVCPRCKEPLLCPVCGESNDPQTPCGCAAAEEAAWYEELDRGYSRDRI